MNERALGDQLKFEDIIDEVAGVHFKIMLNGDKDPCAWSRGMVAGLINDIPTCQDIVENITAEANGISPEVWPM